MGNTKRTTSSENTKITSPENNSLVKDVVSIKVEVLLCNCTANPSLYIGNIFISNGTLVEAKKHDGRWWELFVHEWNTTYVEDGVHQVIVL